MSNNKDAQVSTDATISQPKASETDIQKMLEASGIPLDGSGNSSDYLKFHSRSPDSLSKAEKTLLVAGVTGPDLQVFESTSRAVDAMLEALQQPTLAADPDGHIYYHTGEEPVIWWPHSDFSIPFLKFSAGGRQVDYDDGRFQTDTSDLVKSTAPSVLTLMRMMSEQIASQREAIAELKAEKTSSAAHSKEVEDLKATVYNLVMSMEEHDDIFGRYDNELDHINVSISDLRSQSSASDVQQANNAETIKDLEKSCEDQRYLIAQLRDRQEKQTPTIDELKKENATLSEDIETLRHANSSLETKIESSSKDTSLHLADVLAQRGRLNALEGLVHPKLDDFGSGLATLADRMDKAETTVKSKFTKTKNAVNHNAEVFKQLRSKFEKFVTKTNQEVSGVAEEIDTLRANHATTEENVTVLQGSVSDCTSSTNALQTKFATIMSDVEHLLRTTAAQESLSHLECKQQSFAATSESRLGKIEHELALQSEGVDSRIDNIWDDLNELHGQVDAEADEIARLREELDLERDFSSRLQEAIDDLKESTKAMVTKDSFTELENLQQSFSALSDMRYEEFEARFDTLSDEVNRKFEMTAKNINGVRTKLGNALTITESLRSKQDAQKKNMAGLRSCIDKVTPRVDDVQSKLATIKSEIGGLPDRFAPAQELEKLQQDFHKQQQWLDAFDKDVTDITAKSIPTIEKDIVDISTALEAMGKEKSEGKKAFKQHQSNTESKFKVVDELKQDLVAARQTIAEEKALGRICVEKQNDMEKELEGLIAINYETLVTKIDSDIATLCFNNSLEPPTVDDFEVHAASSPGDGSKASSTTADDFESDGMVDPYGNDTITKKVHDLEQPYYTSYEAEGRRCDVCGNEHSPDCAGNYYESDDDADGDVEEGDIEETEKEGSEVLVEL